jgi:hypothetical protein
MRSACVGVLSIIELKNARWNSEIRKLIIYIGKNLIFSLCTETEHRGRKLHQGTKAQHLQCCTVVAMCELECNPILALTRFLAKFNTQYIIQSREYS